MRTNIEIDDELMNEVLELTGLPTKRAAVDVALRELRRLAAGRNLLALKGKVQFWPGYGHGEDDEIAGDVPDELDA